MTSMAEQEVQSRSTEERCMLISADSHVGPSMRGQLRQYCDQKHLERFDYYVGQVEAATAAVVTQMDVNAFEPSALATMGERSQFPGLEDADARHRDMDTDGIAADVIHHGGLNGQSVPFFRFGLATWGSDEFDDVEPVGVRIYNRWLADFVATAPERHIGIAQISVRDMDAAVAEVRWAKEHGLNAINLPAPRRYFPPYTDESWEPFWAVCSELEINMVSHAGGGDLEGRIQGPAASSIFAMEYPWMGRRGVWHLIFGGVFERYPTLHYTLAEQYGDWIPGTVRDMDSTYKWFPNRASRQSLPRLPSEYFSENVFVTASFMSREEAELGVAGGFVDRLLWGADYPHPEGSFPYSELSLRKTMSGLDRAVIDAYVYGNAAAAYRIDTEALRPIADLIGPSYAAIAEPYTGGTVEDNPSSLAFREFGPFA